MALTPNTHPPATATSTTIFSALFSPTTRKKSTLTQLPPSLLPPLPDFRVRHDFRKQIRTFYLPKPSSSSTWELVSEIVGNCGGKVSKRRPYLLTSLLPTYCTWPHGNIFFLFPDSQFSSQVVHPLLLPRPPHGSHFFPLVLERSTPSARRETNQQATSMRVAC